MYLLKAIIPVQDLIVKSRKLSDLYISSTLVPRLIKESLKELKTTYNDIEFLVPSYELIHRDTNSITNVIFLKIKESDPKSVGEDLNKFMKESLKSMLLDKLLEHGKFKNIDKNLIEYQITNAIRLIWAAIKTDDLHSSKKELDETVAYLKASNLPNDDYIESYKLISKDSNLFYEESFIDFIENQSHINYEHLQGAVLCSLCGQRTIVSANLKDWRAKSFWEDIYERENYIAKEGEKLCGFCLAKRVVSHEEENADFESVVYYALKDYDGFEEINKILRGYDIQCAYEENWKDLPEEKKGALKGLGNNNKLPKYYALLQADGDSMGEKVVKAFESEESLKDFTKKMSECAKGFEKQIKHLKGETIYTGGDDVLAILPKSSALKSYEKISEEFSKLDINKGDKGNLTMSAGIVIAHYKLPLSYVLEKLRENEAKAKFMGKNGVYISYIKHSLSLAGTFIKRDHIKDFNEIVQIMSQNNFPNTFISQLGTLLKPYYDKTNKIEEVKELIKYLINKKSFNGKEEFEQCINKVFIDSTIKDDTTKNHIFEVKNLVDGLKVAKLLAGDTI